MRRLILLTAFLCAGLLAAGTANAADCFITGDLKICPGESREMCGPEGMSSYEWLDPDGNVVGNDRCLTYNQTGMYTLTIVDPEGVTTSCQARVVDRILPPKCLITGSPEICEGGSTELCGPDGSDIYEWVGPNGFSSSNKCITATEPGFYTLTVKSGVSGCEESCEIEVVEATAECSITGDPNFCAGGETELCGPEGASSYSWTGPGDFTSADRCITVSVAGEYNLDVDYDNACGPQSCSVTVSEGSGVPCEITGDREVCEGETTELCGPEGADSYMWTGPGGFESTDRCIQAGEGEYTLRVVSNGCQTECKALVETVPCGGGVNCPRTVGFWGRQAEQKGNGSTKFTEEEVTQIAETIDAKSDFLDWGDDALEMYDAALNVKGRMDQRQQAIRQFVGFLSNVCVGTLGFVASNGDEISLDLDTSLDCDGIDADTLGDAIDAGDALLMELEGMSLDDEDVKAAYTDLISCFDGINNGQGLPNLCGADDEDEDDGPEDEGSRNDRRRGGRGLDAAGKTGLASDSILKLAPNPFGESTAISFAVGRDGATVRIAVYDLAGRLVRTLASGSYAAGEHLVSWDGRSDSGGAVAQGVYLARAVIDGNASTKRVLFLR